MTVKVAGLRTIWSIAKRWSTCRYQSLSMTKFGCYDGKANRRNQAFISLCIASYMLVVIDSGGFDDGAGATWSVGKRCAMCPHHRLSMSSFESNCRLQPESRLCDYFPLYHELCIFGCSDVRQGLGLGSRHSYQNHRLYSTVHLCH
jgi:hypothetical protein